MDDPVMQQKREVDRIEKKLADYMKQFMTKKTKETKTDLAVKQKLKRQLAEERQKFLQEKKKALKVQKELDKEDMKQRGGDFFSNVLCPKYSFNENLKIYIEEDAPPDTLYKSVGYNNLETVKTLMEGNDKEKRSTTDQNKKGAKQPPPDSARSHQELKKIELAAEVEDRKLQVTKKHYRKFYDDELENCKELFPYMPFLSIPIKRGQSRGLKKSWFSFFSTEQQDESGQVTDEKQVGYFKGRIKVVNEEEEEVY